MVTKACKYLNVYILKHKYQFYPTKRPMWCRCGLLLVAKLSCPVPNFHGSVGKWYLPDGSFQQQEVKIMVLYSLFPFTREVLPLWKTVIIKLSHVSGETLRLKTFSVQKKRYIASIQGEHQNTNYPSRFPYISYNSHWGNLVKFRFFWDDQTPTTWPEECPETIWIHTVVVI